MEACWVGMSNERRRRKRQNDNQIDNDDENFVKKVKRQNDIMDQEIENVLFSQSQQTKTEQKDRLTRCVTEVCLKMDITTGVIKDSKSHFELQEIILSISLNKYYLI